MKKIIILIMISTILAGCGRTQEERLSAETNSLKEQIITLKYEISELKMQKETLEEAITDAKIESGNVKYIVTFNIKQKHFTLDITQHLKDSANDISIQIPVDKEYYDSVQIGDTIDDSFRIGSLIFKGSFGSWNITVENKEVV